jgi:hypothetical protein
MWSKLHNAIHDGWHAIMITASPLRVTNRRDDYIDWMSGVRQTADDLLHRASRQPWPMHNKGHSRTLSQGRQPRPALDPAGHQATVEIQLKS